MNPHGRSLSFAFAFAALALLVSACSSSSSSSSSGPVIDDLQVPATFSVSGTTYTVKGTITYHDDSASVTTLHVKIPTYMVDNKTAVNGTQQATDAILNLGFQSQGPVASGTKVEIDVSLIDSNGAESNTEVTQLTVP